MIARCGRIRPWGLVIGVMFLLSCSTPRTDTKRPAVRPPAKAMVGDRAPLGESVGEQPRVTRAEADPDACWQERPCAQPPEGKGSFDALVCVSAETNEQACGPAGCREHLRARRCADATACYEYQSCVVAEGLRRLADSTFERYPQCRPTVCSGDEDCRSANATCHQGSCSRRTCATSGDCPEGYCLEGLCHAHPGTCLHRAELKRP